MITMKPNTILNIKKRKITEKKIKIKSLDIILLKYY